MKLDALKHQGKTSAQVAQKLSVEIVGEAAGESKDQVRRYIRLTNLIPEILQMVDDGRIAFSPAVELSYLPEAEQTALLEAMEGEIRTPSHAQAIKMREISEQGKLNPDVILSIMQEEKPNQVEQFKMPKERIRTCFFAHLQLHTAFHHMSALSLRVGTMYYIHANWCR